MIMALVFVPLRGRPCQPAQHLRDWIHPADWTGTLRSDSLLISPGIVWTSVSPRPLPLLTEQDVCRASLNVQLSQFARTLIHQGYCVKNDFLFFLWKLHSSVDWDSSHPPLHIHTHTQAAQQVEYTVYYCFWSKQNESKWRMTTELFVQHSYNMCWMFWIQLLAAGC